MVYGDGLRSALSCFGALPKVLDVGDILDIGGSLKTLDMKRRKAATLLHVHFKPNIHISSASLLYVTDEEDSRMHDCLVTAGRTYYCYIYSMSESVRHRPRSTASRRFISISEKPQCVGRRGTAANLRSKRRRPRAMGLDQGLDQGLD
jgi:hypothetical protein